MKLTLYRLARSAYVRKYLRRALVPSSSLKRSNAANSGRFKPSRKIIVVSIPPSDRNSSPPSCGSALRYLDMVSSFFFVVDLNYVKERRTVIVGFKLTCGQRPIFRGFPPTFRWG